jgi:hypothetical protein
VKVSSVGFGTLLRTLLKTTLTFFQTENLVSVTKNSLSLLIGGSVLMGSSLAFAAPASSFLSRSFQERSYALPVQRITESELVSGDEIEIDESLEPFLFRSPEQRSDQEYDPEVLAYVITSRMSGLEEARVKSSETGVTIERVELPRRGTFSFAEDRCRELYAPTLLSSNRLRESLGGQIAGFGFSGFNAGKVGRDFTLTYGGSFDEFQLASAVFSQPIGSHDCAADNWIPMVKLSVFNTQI